VQGLHHAGAELQVKVLFQLYYYTQYVMTGLVVSHDGVNIMVGGLIPSQLARVYHVGVPRAFQCSLWFRVVWPSQWVAHTTWPLPLQGDHITLSKRIVVH